MTMLKKEGKIRINKFITDLNAISTQLHSNAASAKLKADMLALATAMRDDDDIKHWTGPNLELFMAMDGSKQTGVPDIFNAESKAVFQLYLELLVDTKANWNDYIPGAIRTALCVFKVTDHIDNMINHMREQLSRYQEKEQALMGDDVSFVSQFTRLQIEIENLAKISPEDFNPEHYAKQVQALYQQIQKIPFPKLLPTHPHINADNVKEYQQKHQACKTVLTQACLLEALLQAEIAVNQALLGAAKPAEARTVTEILHPQIKPANATSFEKNTLEKIDSIIKEAEKYSTDKRADKGKREIAGNLASALRQLRLVYGDQHTSFTQLLTGIHQALSTASMKHSEHIVFERIGAGNFGKLLDGAKTNVNALIEDYSSNRNPKLLSLCLENQALLKTQPSAPLKFVSK